MKFPFLHKSASYGLRFSWPQGVFFIALVVGASSGGSAVEVCIDTGTSETGAGSSNGSSITGLLCEEPPVDPYVAPPADHPQPTFNAPGSLGLIRGTAHPLSITVGRADSYPRARFERREDSLTTAINTPRPHSVRIDNPYIINLEILPTHGDVTINYDEISGHINFTYTPHFNFQGKDAFSLIVYGRNFDFVRYVAHVVVGNPGRTLVSVNGGEVNIPYNGSGDFPVEGSGDGVTLAVWPNSSRHGTFTGTRYTPLEGVVGTDSVIIQGTDAYGDQDINVVRFNMVPSVFTNLVAGARRVLLGTFNGYGLSEGTFDSTLIENGEVLFSLESEDGSGGSGGSVMGGDVDNEPPLLWLLLAPNTYCVRGLFRIKIGANDLPIPPGPYVDRVEVMDPRTSLWTEVPLTRRFPTYDEFTLDYDSRLYPRIEGDPVFRFRAIDVVGNVSTYTVNVPLHIDNTPPLTVFQPPVQQGAIIREPQTIQVQALDPVPSCLGVSSVSLSFPIAVGQIATVTVSGSQISRLWPPDELPDGVYTIKSWAVDNAGNRSEPNTITVTLSRPPLRAVITGDNDKESGQWVNLSGTNSITQPVTYQWSRVGGADFTLLDPTSSNPRFQAPLLTVGQSTNCIVQLVVRRGIHASAPSLWAVRVSSRSGGPGEQDPLIAIPRGDAAGESGRWVNLTGTHSVTQPVTYEWSLAMGPAIEFDDPASSNPRFLGPSLAVGQSTFCVIQLIVRQDSRRSAPGFWTVLISSQNAGEIGGPLRAVVSGDREKESGQFVLLSGTDSVIQPVSYQWTQVLGPAIAINNPTSSNPSFQAPVLPVGQSTHCVIQLIVTRPGFQPSPPTLWTVRVTSRTEGGAVPLVAVPRGDRQKRSGEWVMLTGTHSITQPVAYQWSRYSGPNFTLDDPASATPRFQAPPLLLGESTDCVVQLIVSRAGQPPSVPAYWTVRITSETMAAPPVRAVISGDRDGQSGQWVMLSGTNSVTQPVTYQWSRFSGPAITFDNPTSDRPRFRGPALTVGQSTACVVRLIVSKSGQNSAPAYWAVIISSQGAGQGVQEPLRAVPMGDREKRSGQTVVLTGTHSVTQPVTYHWSRYGGAFFTLNNPASANPSFTAPTVPVGQSTYCVVQLVVIKNQRVSPPAFWTVLIASRPAGGGEDEPLHAIPGGEAEKEAGQFVQLTGTNSVTQPISSYQWSQVSGPPVAFDNPAIARPRFRAPSLTVGQSTVCVVQLVVTKAARVSAPAYWSVLVTSRSAGGQDPGGVEPLVAIPIGDTEGRSGQWVELNGADSITQPVQYLWTRFLGPAIVINNPTSAAPRFSAPALQVGRSTECVVQLVVFKGQRASVPAYWTVRISSTTDPGPEEPLQAVPGGDREKRSGEWVRLSGLNSITQPVTYQWTKAGGPDFTIVDPTSSTPRFLAPSVAIGQSTICVVRLVVSKNSRRSSPSLWAVQITSEPETGIVPLRAVPEGDVEKESGQVVQLSGVNSITQPVNYQWSRFRGPAIVFSDDRSPTPTFVAPALSVGQSTDCIVQLTVSRAGQPVSDPAFWTVRISSYAPGEGPPHPLRAVIRGDRERKSGEWVLLSGTDSITQPVEYRWTRVSGPLFSIVDPNAANPRFLAPTIPVGQSTICVVQLIVSRDRRSSAPEFFAVSISSDSQIEEELEPLLAVPSGDRERKSGELVALSGSESLTPPLNYHWTRFLGPDFTIQNPTSVNPTFVAPSLTVGQSTVCVVQLTVFKGARASVPAYWSVRVSSTSGPGGDPEPLAAVPSGDRERRSGQVVVLSGTHSITQPVTYNWTRFSGPDFTFGDPTSSTPSFIAPAIGVGQSTMCVARLVVSKAGRDSAPSYWAIRISSRAADGGSGGVEPPPLVARPDGDRAKKSGEWVMLTGTNSITQPVNYYWERALGPSFTIENPTSSNPRFQGPPLTVGQSADCVVQLTVFRDNRVSVPSFFTVRITSSANDGNPPAGGEEPLQAVINGDFESRSNEWVNLAGTHSITQPVTYQWSRYSGAPFAFENATAGVTRFRAPLLQVGQSTYTVAQLIVSKGGRNSVPAFRTVHISSTGSGGGSEPVLRAVPGGDMDVEAGQWVLLTGTNSLTPPLEYRWTRVSGPSFTLQNPLTAQPRFRAPENVPLGQSVLCVVQLVVAKGAETSAPAFWAVRVSSRTQSSGVPQSAVAFLSPAPNALVRGLIQLRAETSGPIQSFQFRITPPNAAIPDLIRVEGTQRIIDEWNTRGPIGNTRADGVYTLQAAAQTPTGAVSDSISIRIDNTPPSAAFTLPAANRKDDLHGVETIRVRAGDANGINNVDIIVGTHSFSLRPQSPAQVDFDVAYDTFRRPDGPVTLVANVTDNAGNISNATLQAVINNTNRPAARVNPHPQNHAFTIGNEQSNIRITVIGSQFDLASVNRMGNNAIQVWVTQNGIRSAYPGPVIFRASDNTLIFGRDVPDNSDVSWIVSGVLDQEGNEVRGSYRFKKAMQASVGGRVSCYINGRLDVTIPPNALSKDMFIDIATVTEPAGLSEIDLHQAGLANGSVVAGPYLVRGETNDGPVNENELRSPINIFFTSPAPPTELGLRYALLMRAPGDNFYRPLGPGAPDGARLDDTQTRNVSGAMPKFGRLIVTAYAQPAPGISESYAFPNPFDPHNGGVDFNYFLSEDSDVDIYIYDLMGNLVYEAKIPRGLPGGKANTNIVHWDGRNGEGKVVGNGGYIVHVFAKDTSSGQSKVMMKVGVVK